MYLDLFIIRNTNHCICPSSYRSLWQYTYSSLPPPLPQGRASGCAPPSPRGGRAASPGVAPLLAAVPVLPPAHAHRRRGGAAPPAGPHAPPPLRRHRGHRHQLQQVNLRCLFSLIFCDWVVTTVLSFYHIY